MVSTNKRHEMIDMGYEVVKRRAGGTSISRHDELRDSGHTNQSTRCRRGLGLFIKDIPFTREQHGRV